MKVRTTNFRIPSLCRGRNDRPEVGLYAASYRSSLRLPGLPIPVQPYRTLGSRPLRPRRRSRSGASSDTGTAGGKTPIARHSSACGLSSSQSPSTNRSGRTAFTPMTLARSRPLDDRREVGFWIAVKQIALMTVATNYFARPAPDPAQFGMTTEDDGSRDDPLLSDRSWAVSSYRPDFDALVAAPTSLLWASRGLRAHLGGSNGTPPLVAHWVCLDWEMPTRWHSSLALNRPNSSGIA